MCRPHAEWSIPVTLFLTTAPERHYFPYFADRQTEVQSWGVISPGTHSEAEGRLENSNCLTFKSAFPRPSQPSQSFCPPTILLFGVSPTLRLTSLVLPWPWARSGQLWPLKGLERKHRGGSEAASSSPTPRLDPAASTPSLRAHPQ